MSNRCRKLSPLILAVACAVQAFGQDVPTVPLDVKIAPAGKLALQADPAAIALPGNGVEYHLNGAILDPPCNLLSPINVKGDLGDALNLVVTDIKMFKAEDWDHLKQLYNPAALPALSKLLANPKATAAMAQGFSSIQTLQAKLVLKEGNQVFVFCRIMTGAQKPGVIPMAVKKEVTGWKMDFPKYDKTIVNLIMGYDSETIIVSKL